MRYPNIIVLVLDAVRARNMSVYGYPERTTPHIDAFAERHILFERAFTTSTWTIPTHQSMLSGLYLSQHGIETMDTNLRLNESVVSLPAALRKIGYDTAGFSQNLLFSPHFHFDTFDEFHTPETLSGAATGQTYTQKPLPGNSSMGMLRRYAHKSMSLRPFIRSLEEWITARPPNNPFFLVANISHVHAPWAPSPVILLRKLGRLLPGLFNPEFSDPGPFQFNSQMRPVTDRHREIWRRLYNAALIHTDREIGNLLRRLQEWLGWKDTVLILTADHGEILGDHRDIFGHTLTLNDRVMHIPLVLKHPDYSRPGRVNGVVQLLDLYPSIVGWTGAGGMPAAQLQRPPLDRALGAPEDIAGVAIAEEDYTRGYDVIAGLRKVNAEMPPDLYPRSQTAYRTANFKLMEYDDRPTAVFNLCTDPDEESGYTAERPDGHLETIRVMEAELASWRANLETFPPRHATSAPEGVFTQRLKDLGYLP